MKKFLSRVLYVLAVILSYMMCIVVTYRYCVRLCDINGTAKFPWALLVLFLLAIVVCVFFGIRFGKSGDDDSDE